MGYVYPRGSRLWIGYRDGEGRPVQRSTGLDVGREAEAEEMLAAVEAAPGGRQRPEADWTVARYGRDWLALRIRSGTRSGKLYASALDHHIIPIVGRTKLEDLRVSDSRRLVAELRNRGKSERTVSSYFGVFKMIIDSALADELITADPTRLPRGERPRDEDLDPAWRRTALFTRHELERLCSDGRIPRHRRVLWTILGLLGPRIGEAAALQWRSYDQEWAPLSAMVIERQWSTSRHQFDVLKTRDPRMTPIIPVVADVLDRWRERWSDYAGRRPTEDDLIVPQIANAAGKLYRKGDLRPYSDAAARRLLHSDLAALGLRKRRTHDFRRTFTSIARNAGAERDVLDWALHGRGRKVIDQYTELEWARLCREVNKIKVSISDPSQPSLPGIEAATQVDEAPRSGELRARAKDAAHRRRGDS